MKKRTFEKKLGLHKITVANLSHFQMMHALGGAEPQCTIDCTDMCETAECRTIPDISDGEPGTTHG